MSGWVLDPYRMRQRTGWTPARVTLAQLIAVAAPVGVSVGERGSAQIAVLVTATISCLLWELAFAFIRGRGPSLHMASVGLVFAILVPVTVPLWQVAMAASFGVVFGELVFGGRGYGIVSGSAAAAGFMVFSFTGVDLSATSVTMALATVPGAVLLLWGGLISWRVLLSAVAVLTAAELARQGVGGLTSVPTEILTSAVFGLVFLVADPVAAASTQPGRWIHGLLAGVLIILFDTLAGPAIAPAAIVFASLLASLFAPLIDHLAVALIVRRRRRRHG